MGNREVFKKRRDAFIDGMTGDAVAIFAAAPVTTRNNDVENEYRQESDFYYLSGFDEPESVLVLSAKDRKTTLFVRARDPEREIWDGPRAGVEGAKGDFGADDAFVIGAFDEHLPKLLQDNNRLYFRLGRDRALDERLLAVIDKGRTRARATFVWPSEIIDPGSVLHEMRLFKSAEDVASMRKAAEITADAHKRAMAAAKPGMHEYEIEALLLEAFRRHGSERPAYGSIVGSGPNATILHYRSNNRKMEAGDLLLIDAGCEFEYFASDVTRTLPVSGTFSKEQRAIYEIVLEAQLASIEATRPGATLEEIHSRSVEVITAGLARVGILAGETEKLINEEAYRPFFMHRTSHWLGMDVHDVGLYFRGGKPRKLEAGMVITVEPGIYIGKDCEKVEARWRGIGVRIEDDILVTEAGPINLTQAIPKTVAEVEQACRA
jgi:Xaa-Pro aminopeptidase